MRKSFDGLMAVIRDNFQMDPFSNAVFLFCGRKKNTMKALYFDRDGFVLLQKRLDNGKFQWPRNAKATREDQYGNLPIHKEVIPLPEEDKYCPYCNSKMEYVTNVCPGRTPDHTCEGGTNSLLPGKMAVPGMQKRW